MLCTACGTAFTPKRHQEGSRFCSNKCRAAFWRRRKRQAQDERDREVMVSLDEAAQAIQRARVAVSGEGEDSA